MSAYSGVALVVGAGSADGRAVCRALIRAGCTRLALADTHASSLKASEADCRGLARTKGLIVPIIFVQTCDFHNEADLDALLSSVVSHFGRLDYCANCLRPAQTLQQVPEVKDGDDSVLHPSMFGQGQPLKGPFYAWQRAVWLCIRAQVTHIMKQQETSAADGAAPTTRSKTTVASIVTISAAQGLASEGGDHAALCAAAHAIIGTTRATAMDYVREGIRLNCVCPTFDGRGPGDDVSGVPAITADDVAEAVVFLLGERSRMVNGIALPVDAGWCLYHR